MTDDETYWTAKAMRCYGGSFVQQLGLLVTLADSANLAKIRATWPEYWSEYKTFGESLRAREEEE